ncbi:F0F1 ATP synthase subunit epsilon [Nisaea sediminum]|uniref:F0F1 ATP synthase subunit epsilon n=1 Tax=Nisaea sediminum TaxID=2775867 RepID=UPI0018680D47|nr:F0F1 ATP synthase subunit epsilon [Nisaea sediminum]
MKLVVSTPLSVVVEADHVAHLRAEDETGAFGILPGHADFLTALTISVVTWRDGSDVEHCVAVRGGMLEMRDGNRISIATREAIAHEDLDLLETEVLENFRRHVADERASRLDAHRLYLAAIHQIQTALRPGPPGFGRQDLPGPDR